MSNKQFSTTNSPQSIFSIVTPSYNQLAWLRLCVASVRDQVEGVMSDELRVASDEVGNTPHAFRHPLPATGHSPPLAVEHIIQDAGTPGIEEFAREIGADFYRDGELQFAAVAGEELRVTSGEWRVAGGEWPVASGGAEVVSDPAEKLDIQGTSKSYSFTPLSGSPPATRHPLPATPRSGYRIAVYSERDGGMYDALNRGLARSSGAICAWLNSDEQYLPGTLQYVAEQFSQKPDMQILLGDAILTDAQNQPICYRRIMVPGRWHTRLDHLHSLSCAMFFRPEILPDPPMDTRWKVIGDTVLMHYWLNRKVRIEACKKPLATYAFTGSNLSFDESGVHEITEWNRAHGLCYWFFRRWVVLVNRLRRAKNGAYVSRQVKAQIYTHRQPKVRISMQKKLGGTWPGAK